MTPEELQAWSEQQIKALQAIGIDALDAQRTVKWVLDHLPPNADPNTWVPTLAQLDEPVDSEATLTDARADWYAAQAIPSKFKRILDATLTET